MTSPLDTTALVGALGRLPRRLGIDRDEVQQAEAFVEVAEEIFSDLGFAVRLVHPTTLRVVAHAASNGVGPEDPEGAPLPLPEAALARLRNADALQATGRLRLARADDVVPLVADEQLVGIVEVERAHPETPLDPAAAQALELACAMLAAAVRDRRLARDVDYIRDRLERIINAAHALILVLDAQHRIAVFNRRLCEVTGYSAEEARGEDLLRWVPVAEHGVFLEAFERARAGESSGTLELTLRTRDGSSRRAILTLALPAEPGEASEAVVAIGQDVTALKQLEHQVRQAEKLATLGQLAAGVVHEINNPLTSVSVYAEFLIKQLGAGGADPSHVDKLNKILEGSNRILKFTRDLVNYAKPSEEQFDVLSLNEIVEQSVSFCEHTSRKASAELQVELGSDLPPIYGVKDQLHQVMINLVTNACHSLDEGGGEVTIQTAAPDDGTVVVEVTDNGRGIAGSDLPQIFEPFFSTKAAGEGTGLGLSIVKKIVDFHKGSIMVESTPRRGTTFTVTLPTGRPG